ncbi:hypothetical protein HDZ31DRAFT_45918 [Schizophyllum fasciatum]
MWLGSARAGAFGILRGSHIPCRTFTARALAAAPQVPSPYRNFSWSRCHAARLPLGSRPVKEGTPEVEKLSEASKEQPDAKEPGLTFYETVARPGVARQILWFLGFSAFAFPTAAWLTEQSTNRWVDTVRYTSHWGPMDNNLLRAREQTALVERLRAIHRTIYKGLSAFPSTVRANVSHIYVAIFQPIADASQPKKIAWSLCFAMGAVFMMQNIPRLQPFMRRNFVHSALSGMSITLLTSTFAHAGFIHFAVNMLAFEGFSSSTVVYLAKAQDREQRHGIFEASPFWHFLAFFCVAGAFSSLAHHVIQVKVTYPRLVRQYANALARQAAAAASAVGRTKTWADAVRPSHRVRRRWIPRLRGAIRPGATEVEVLQDRLKRALLPSVGASGAIYACLVVTALAFPHAEVALFFPPGMSMNIQTGVLGAIAMDIAGVIFGWSYLAHWAHLGGALFGYLYYNYGPALWADLRRVVHEEAAKEEGGPVKRLF